MARTAERVAGRDVLAIQDTSEIILGGAKIRARGYGPVGKGGALGGVLLHPVLAVDAATGALLGLADITVWNRDTGKASPHPERGLADKESGRWLAGAERAGAVLARASRITAVSDRESDIYEDFARRPEGVHLLVRASFNRRLDGGKLLFDHADGLAEAGRFATKIAAAPGRPARTARLALRFGPVEIRRPEHGMPAAERKALPKTVSLSIVDIREEGAPKGTAPIHWRLLTSHVVEDLADAFDEDDRPVIAAICQKYHGPAPTKRQTNPHPEGTMAHAAWVIARLGAWTGYYGKPGPQVISRGLQKYHAIKYGVTIGRKVV